MIKKKPFFSPEFFNYSSIFMENALKQNAMNCACNLHLRLAVKTKQQKNINIYTYTYIFEKPFDCIFAWKIKKTKTNPISITTVTPLLSKDQNLTKRKKINKSNFIVLCKQKSS